MGSRVFLGGKVMQEENDRLRGELQAERDLSMRNALQAVKFQKALEIISGLHKGARTKTCASIAKEALGLPDRLNFRAGIGGGSK